MESQITVTQNVVNKVAELVHEKGSAEKLRVYITGGGCTGFQYGFKLDENINDDDTRLDFTTQVNDEPVKVSVLIDSLSIQYLASATIDYVQDLKGAYFKINNPNATTTCGCGSSFAVD